jgi:hypothetical protein
LHCHAKEKEEKNEFSIIAMCGVHRREKMECQELARCISLFLPGKAHLIVAGLPVGPIRFSGARERR